MKPILFLVTIYTAFVLQVAGAPSATPLPAVNLLAATALLIVVVGDARTALNWLVGIGLLDDVLHDPPLGLAAATGVLAALLLWKSTRDESPVVRWTARAFFVTAFTLVPPVARDLISGNGFRLDPRLVGGVLHTLAFVGVAATTHLAVQFFVLGTAARRHRHGF